MIRSVEWDRPLYLQTEPLNAMVTSAPDDLPAWPLFRTSLQLGKDVEIRTPSPQGSERQTLQDDRDSEEHPCDPFCVYSKRD